MIRIKNDVSMRMNDRFHCDQWINHIQWCRIGEDREQFPLHKTWSLFDCYSTETGQ